MMRFPCGFKTGCRNMIVACDARRRYCDSCNSFMAEVQKIVTMMNAKYWRHEPKG